MKKMFKFINITAVALFLISAGCLDSTGMARILCLVSLVWLLKWDIVRGILKAGKFIKEAMEVK